MSAVESAVALEPETPGLSRRWIITGGRVLLAVALVLAWEWGARVFGKLFFAAPLEVLLRLGAMAVNGEMWADVMATLRVSALGFVVGAGGGLVVPFLLRLSARATEAIEPYIIASMGIPKYALAPWLILWFGIGDLPKLVIVALMVFYIIFVTIFAGIRSVDRRLVDMARIVGASEAVISREVIWKSLQPFFFSGIKIALPRAVSACIVGEFLVSTEGIGYYIEHARAMSDTTGVFAGIVLATALVLVINVGVEWLERRALAWRPLDHEMAL